MAEHFLRLLQHCGMPGEDVDFVHGDGRVVNKIFREGRLRSTLFTGSQAVADQLVVDLKGKVRPSPPLSLSLLAQVRPPPCNQRPGFVVGRPGWHEIWCRRHGRPAMQLQPRI